MEVHGDDRCHTKCNCTETDGACAYDHFKLVETQVHIRNPCVSDRMA